MILAAGPWVKEGKNGNYCSRSVLVKNPPLIQVCKQRYEIITDDVWLTQGQSFNQLQDALQIWIKQNYDDFVTSLVKDDSVWTYAPLDLAEKATKAANKATLDTSVSTEPRFLVDIPNPATIGKDYNAWIKVGETFRSKIEAVQWIRENIGQCDEEGRISLLSET